MNVEPTNEQVDGIFEHYTKAGSPGCAVAVIKEGEIVYKQGYGLADVESELPILPSTVFNIGSMAKQFTAFAIALLEGEGELSFDDDFRQYLPEMHDFGPTITLRHLIHHTSGIRCTFPDLLTLAGWREGDMTSMEDVLRLLRAQRDLDFAPGSEYAYANSNYILLAWICERVSGRTFADFCRERVFGPLGMSRTVVNDAIWKIIPGRACGYWDDGQGNWFNAPLADAVVGSTNVYSTVEDLARWDENLTTGQVGGPAVLKQMYQPGRLDDGTVLDYAFGLMVHQHRGWQVVEHGGGQGGYCGYMARFPELHLSVVVLFNHFLWGAGREYAFQVADLFLEDNPAGQDAKAGPALPGEAVEPVELAVEQLQDKVGKYFNARRAALRDISLVEGRLQYQGYDLVPLRESTFFIEAEPDVQVEFRPATGEMPAGVKTITSSGEYRYDRVEVVSPSPDDLVAYAGLYYSPELKAYWTLVVDGDYLVAKRQKYVDTKLTPLFRDAFDDDWSPIMGFPWNYLVVFERDAEDAVDGLRVSGTRGRNIRFVRQVT